MWSIVRANDGYFDRLLPYGELVLRGLGSILGNGQKQPPEEFYKKGVLRIFAKFTGKHL